MRALYMLILCLMLSGCVVTKEVYGPDGSPAYTLNCTDSSWDACYEEAGKLCGTRGYEIIKENSDAQAAGSLSSDLGIFAMQTEKVMLIQCKDEPKPIM